MYDLEEQEQIDALKAWWKANRRGLGAAVLVGGLVAGGITLWRHHQHAQAEEASLLYAALEKSARAGETAKVKEVAQRLASDFGSTPYGVMGAMVGARVAYEAGDAKQAEEQLRFALDHAKGEEAAAAVRLRLAGLLLDQKRQDEALRLLDAAHPESFSGLYAERRGDVLVTQGKQAEARSAYKAALEKLAAGDDYRGVLQVKIDSLGGQ